MATSLTAPTRNGEIGGEPAIGWFHLPDHDDLARFPTAPPKPEPVPDQGRVRAVGRALALLQLMARTERSSWSLDELSRLSDLPKSTTHRLLETMITCGFVEHGVEPGYYRLGLQAAVVGSASMRLRRPENLVQRTLDSVRSRTDESVGLAVLSDRHSVTVARSVSLQPLRWDIEIGGIFPAHAAAGGKVLLAALPPEEVVARYADVPRLPAFTDATITRVSALLTHLERVREDGFAIDQEEFRPGLSCICVPVRVGDMPPRHALGISVPSVRGERRRLLAALPVLRAGADALSNALALDAYE